MLEILQFVFSGFWIWFGSLIMLTLACGTLAAFRPVTIKINQAPILRRLSDAIDNGSRQFDKVKQEVRENTEKVIMAVHEMVNIEDSLKGVEKLDEEEPG